MWFVVAELVGFEFSGVAVPDLVTRMAEIKLSWECVRENIVLVYHSVVGGLALGGEVAEDVVTHILVSNSGRSERVESELVRRVDLLLDVEHGHRCEGRAKRVPIDHDVRLWVLLQILIHSLYHLRRDSLISLVEARVNEGTLRGTRVLHLEEVDVLDGVDLPDGASENNIDALGEAIVGDVPLNTEDEVCDHGDAVEALDLVAGGAASPSHEAQLLAIGCSGVVEELFAQILIVRVAGDFVAQQGY